MINGPGASASSTDTRSVVVNRNANATDNAVLNQPIHSNNPRTTVTNKNTVAKNGTLNITYGMSDEAFQEYVNANNERLDQLLEAKQNDDGSEGPVPQDVIDAAIAKRLAEQAKDNIENAPAREKANKIKAGAIVGAILIIAALALVFGKKKKGTA